MKELTKAVGCGVILLLAALAVPQANAYGWGPYYGWGPSYGHGWGNTYVYDPAYRWGSIGTRRYIRDLYRYGPAYAQWRRNLYGWW